MALAGAIVDVYVVSSVTHNCKILYKFQCYEENKCKKVINNHELNNYTVVGDSHSDLVQGW